MGLLNLLFRKRANKTAEIYEEGRACARQTIRERGPGNELEAVWYLRSMAEGAFDHDNPDMAAFDRGVIDVCYETEQEFGAP